MPEPVAAAAVEAAMPQWVELAAGEALRHHAPEPVLPARRPIELELDAARAREDGAHAAPSGGADAAAPGRLYRVFRAAILTVVMSFFAGGTGMAVYVLVRH